MSDFDDLVEELTATHVVVLPVGDEPIQLATGRPSRFVKVEGLLQQLAEAVLGNHDSSRSGSRSSSPALPIDAAAIDLLDEITYEIAEAWRAVHPEAAVMPFRSPEVLLRQWAATRPDANDVFNGWRTDDWLRSLVQRITDFFDPPRLREVTGQCPACEVAVVDFERGGEHFREPALVIVLDRRTGESQALKCRACGESWDRSQIERVARIITGDTRTEEELIS